MLLFATSSKTALTWWWRQKEEKKENSKFSQAFSSPLVDVIFNFSTYKMCLIYLLYDLKFYRQSHIWGREREKISSEFGVFVESSRYITSHSTRQTTRLSAYTNVVVSSRCGGEWLNENKNAIPPRLNCCFLPPIFPCYNLLLLHELLCVAEHEREVKFRRTVKDLLIYISSVSSLKVAAEHGSRVVYKKMEEEEKITHFFLVYLCVSPCRLCWNELSRFFLSLSRLCYTSSNSTCYSQEKVIFTIHTRFALSPSSTPSLSPSRLGCWCENHSPKR